MEDSNPRIGYRVPVFDTGRPPMGTSSVVGSEGIEPPVRYRDWVTASVSAMLLLPLSGRSRPVEHVAGVSSTWCEEGWS